MRSICAVALSALLISPLGVSAAPAAGTVQGVVSIAGNPTGGLGIALVHLSTGRVFNLRSGQSGSFEAQVPPGQYIITSREAGGLGVVSAPTMVTVTPGQVTTARLELGAPLAAVVSVAGFALQEGDPEVGDIDHDPFSCFVSKEGQGPVIDACFPNLSPSQVKAEVFFSSGQNPDEFYSVEMTCEPGPTGGSCCTGVLPWPTPEADPMTYYVTANGGEIAGGPETEHYEVSIIPEGDSCEGRVAALAPAGALAALGGGGLAVPVIIAGAAAGTAAGVAVATSGTPTPTPTPAPPTPTPTPAPPTPTPTPPEPTPTPTPPAPTPTPTPTPPEEPPEPPASPVKDLV